jgi:O-acetyl-ADP-ribose deacetylase (regulator of RNase III)
MKLDNAIHCAAGPALRNECRHFMESRGNEVFPVGIAVLTRAYSLPSDFVLHCVGPCASYPNQEQPEELSSCYRSCLDLARENNLTSVAFCCISTGLFGYPAKPATLVALTTVKEWLEINSGYPMERVVFNVFTEKDLLLYQELGPIVNHSDQQQPVETIS